jgi:MurNAc alpha-1-phosphate uridylyltransferase
MLRHAFVFAGGFGTRLRPYTNHTPKPLLEVSGRPMLHYLLRYLAHAGVQHVTVNAAHLAEQFADLPAAGPALGLDLHVSMQAEPLEHAGDLAFATDCWDRAGDHVVAGFNGDTLFWLDPDVLHAAADCVTEQAPVLILTHQTEANPLHSAAGQLLGVGQHAYREGHATTHADDIGIKLFHPSVRRFLPEPGQRGSLHGPNSLVERVVNAGLDVRTQPVTGFERVEIGTTTDYEARADNAALRALTDRLAALPLG